MAFKMTPEKLNRLRSAVRAVVGDDAECAIVIAPDDTTDLFVVHNCPETIVELLEEAVEHEKAQDAIHTIKVQPS